MECGNLQVVYITKHTSNIFWYAMNPYKSSVACCRIPSILRLGKLKHLDYGSIKYPNNTFET